MDAAQGHYRNIGAESREVEFNPAYKERLSVSRDILDAGCIHLSAQDKLAKR